MPLPTRAAWVHSRQIGGAWCSSFLQNNTARELGRYTRLISLQNMGANLSTQNNVCYFPGRTGDARSSPLERVLFEMEHMEVLREKRSTTDVLKALSHSLAAYDPVVVHSTCCHLHRIPSSSCIRFGIDRPPRATSDQRGNYIIVVVTRTELPQRTFFRKPIALAQG